jgi:Cu/Ag efflux pump CusA
VDYDSTLDKIEDVNDAYAGLFRETQTYLDERIEEVISGGKEPIVVRVYGQNLSVLREKADEIEKIMGTIEGVQDQHTDISTDVPQLQVEVNLAKADKYGLKPATYVAPLPPLSPGRKWGISSVPARLTT